MFKSEFKELIKTIKSNFKMNDKFIDKALKEEKSKNNAYNFDRVNELIDKYEDYEDFKSENKKIAICYTGNPIVTISYILDAFVNDNKITLVVNDNMVITNLLISLILDSLVDCKMKNMWIDYDKTYNEVLLRDHAGTFNKIVYIGDYYEYEQFKHFINAKNVEYNNYGYIKLFIDKKIYKEEFDRIFKYCKSENICLEVYDDVDDFVNENKEEDYSVIFADIKILNEIKKRFRGGQLLMNTFPYNNYEFTITK